MEMYCKLCSPCCPCGNSVVNTEDSGDSKPGEGVKKEEEIWEPEELPSFEDGNPERDIAENLRREERERGRPGDRELTWKYPWEDKRPDWSDLTGERKRRRKIYCQTGYDLAIFPNGKVHGVTSPSNRYALLEFETAGFAGELRIRGVVTGFYLTMTSKGRIIGQPSTERKGTVWIETRIPGSLFYAFLSFDYAHLGHYLAIKRSGKPKAGQKTGSNYPQKAISFLSRIITESGGSIG